MSETTYTAKELEAIFGPGAADHARKLLSRAESAVDDGVAALEESIGKIFYHLYVCPSTVCLKTANPSPGSWHQRGVHLASSTPRTDVKCPGCGKPMVIGRNGLTADGKTHPDGHITEDRDGNAVVHGEPIIQEAPGQEDETAAIEKENGR